MYFFQGKIQSNLKRTYILIYTLDEEKLGDVEKFIQNFITLYFYRKFPYSVFSVSKWGFSREIGNLSLICLFKNLNIRYAQLDIIMDVWTCSSEFGQNSLCECTNGEKSNRTTTKIVKLQKIPNFASYNPSQKLPY